MLFKIRIAALAIFCVIFSPLAHATETFLETTQTWYSYGFPSPATFYHMNGNNAFQDANGTVHMAYVDNYELYYVESTDGGVTWQNKEKVPTGHDGDIRTAAIVVDHNGRLLAVSCG